MKYLNKEITELAIHLGMEVEKCQNDTVKPISYYDLINWIFNDKFLDTEITVFDYNEDNQIHWLEAWYSKIISEIEGDELLFEGFVGMILNWFERNGYDCNTYPCFVFNAHHNFEIIKDRDFDTIVKGINYKISTKQEARHLGILKCFEMIKNEKDKPEIE